MKLNRLIFALIASTCPMLWVSAGTTNPSAPPAKINLDFDFPFVLEYRGDIGGKLPIGLTLRFEKDGKTATGCYFYYKYCKDIRIECTANGRSITMNEFDPDDHQTGHFVGEFPTADPRHHFESSNDLQTEVIVGTWSKQDGSKPQSFYLSQVSHGDWLPGTSRYAFAGFDDEEAVNRFFSHFRQAVLDGDAEKVAGMIRFPISVTIDGKHRKITNSKFFRTNYNKIFLPNYVERIRQLPPCHLFSRDQGVMMGDGEVWVVPAQSDEKYIAAIIAINNDIDHGKH